MFSPNQTDIERKTFLKLLLESGIKYIDMSNPLNPILSTKKASEHDVDISLLLKAMEIYSSLENT